MKRNLLDYSHNLITLCEICACLVKHNADVLAGIDIRHTQTFNCSKSFSFVSFHSHLLSPSGKLFNYAYLCCTGEEKN